LKNIRQVKYYYYYLKISLSKIVGLKEDHISYIRLTDVPLVMKISFYINNTLIYENKEATEEYLNFKESYNHMLENIQCNLIEFNTFILI